MSNDNTNTGFFSRSNDLRNRILFTILVLSVYRLGTYIPLSGIDSQSLQTLMDSNQKGLMGMLNIFSGGSQSSSATSGESTGYMENFLVWSYISLIFA